VEHSYTVETKVDDLCEQDLSALPMVRALWEYQGTPNELSFVENDFIRVVAQKSAGWNAGYHLKSKSFGVFPENYTAPVEDKA